MAFSRRIISLKFQLGQGDFGEAGVDTVDLTGLRTSANITKAGGLSMTNLDLRVWGVAQDTMNKLTVLNKLAFPQQRYNTVVVSAGDQQSGTAVCFQGTIQEAWADGREAPDIMFHVAAFSGLFESSKVVPPVSYNGSVDIALVVAGIAQQMGLEFQNSGVTGQLANPYLPGTLGNQLRRMAEAANFRYEIDTTNQTLAIWPKGGSRDGASVLISPSTGLVGFPAFTQNGIQLTTLYNPSLAFGRTITVDSAFTPANGQWTVASVSHNLDANMPGGQWFTEVECSLLGQEVPIIG